ncbi:MAG: hypothetical protein R3E47_05100 [Paracoccaceae bacterium]
MSGLHARDSLPENSPRWSATRARVFLLLQGPHGRSSITWADFLARPGDRRRVAFNAGDAVQGQADLHSDTPSWPPSGRNRRPEGVTDIVLLAIRPVHAAAGRGRQYGLNLHVFEGLSAPLLDHL